MSRTITSTEHDGNFLFLQHDGDDLAVVQHVANPPEGVAALTDEEVSAWGARVGACVNACAGINPDAVPDLLAALIAVNGDVDLDRVAGGSTELAYMVANAIAKATDA